MLVRVHVNKCNKCNKINALTKSSSIIVVKHFDKCHAVDGVCLFVGLSVRVHVNTCIKINALIMLSSIVVKHFDK